MPETPTTLAPFYSGWDRYQSLLTEAIAPLSDEQLALTAAPHLRPVWHLAGHIVGARVGWFCRVLGEGRAEFEPIDAWDEDQGPPRTAEQLVDGLNRTWALIDDCLHRWTPAMLDDSFTTWRGRTRARQWVIWHVLEHDLHHGGELFFTLGMHGLPTPDL